MNESLEKIGRAISRIPAGCSILTVEYGGRSTGMLVSWVQQAAFEPPLVTVCVKRGRPATELIDASKRFLLNVVGESTAELLKHFGRGFSAEQDAFTGLTTEPTEFGPRLADAIAHLGCLVREKVQVGDHDLYVAEVTTGDAAEDGNPYIHLRRNGFSY